MNNTILKKQWGQGKRSTKGTWKTSFVKNPSARNQQKDPMRALHEVIQELTYGATKDAIEKKLAYANKQWTKNYYKRLK